METLGGAAAVTSMALCMFTEFLRILKAIITISNVSDNSHIKLGHLWNLYDIY